MATESLKSYRGLPVSVLGAAGFIGRWVARALCVQGANVSLIVRDRSEASRIWAQYSIAGTVHEVDLYQPEALERAIEAIQPVVTFNLAGYGVDRSERDEAAAYRINTDLPPRLCAAIGATRPTDWPGQNLVHVGSALEYGLATGDLNEATAPCPTTVYGQSKLGGTQRLTAECTTRGLKGLTARLFTVYGPGEHPTRLLPALLAATKTPQLLPLTAGTQQRDFVYVGDVAEGLLRLGLAAAKSGEIVNLASGKLTSVRRFVETAAACLNLPLERLQFGAMPPQPEEMRHRAIAINRLRELTCWTPLTSIEEGIRRTTRFLESNERPKEEGHEFQSSLDGGHR